MIKAIRAARANVAVLAATAAVAILSSPVAMAAIDVTDTVKDIDGTKAPIGLIGIAVLGVVVALAAFVSVRKAIRG